MTPRTDAPTINPAYTDANLDICTGTGQPINVGPAPRRFIFPIIFKRQSQIDDPQVRIRLAQDFETAIQIFYSMPRPRLLARLRLGTDTLFLEVEILKDRTLVYARHLALELLRADAEKI